MKGRHQDYIGVYRVLIGICGDEGFQKSGVSLARHSQMGLQHMGDLMES